MNMNTSTTCSNMNTAIPLMGITNDTLRRGVLKGLVFRRMHFLRPSAPDGLGDLFNDTFDTFLRSSCFPFDTLLRSSCCSFVDRHLLDRSNVRIILRKSL